MRGHLKMTRKEPKNHMKKVSKHILSVLKYTLLAGFLFPIINLNNLVETWLNPYHWLECLIAITVVYAIMVYCTEINPRTFYPAVGVASSTAVYVLSVFAFCIACIVAICVDTMFLKTLIIAGTIVLDLLAVYIFCCRGVVVYENGRVIVFGLGLKFKTIREGTLENVTLQNQGKKFLVNFIINGEDHTFLLSMSSLEALEKRVKMKKIS